VNAILDPLPIERMWGVGPATAARFHALGVRTIGALREWSEERLAREVGAVSARHFARLARGDDDRPVVPDFAGEEHRPRGDVRGRRGGRGRGARRPPRAGGRVGRRVRRHHVRARGVTVKIRYGDFETITRSATLDEPTDLSRRSARAAAELFDRWLRRPSVPSG